MTALETTSPHFAVGIRGYDRAQVDEYIEYLQGLVLEAERRAEDAQTEFVFDQHAAIGPRVAEIFALAEAEARDLRDSVGSQSTGLIEQARKQAQEIVAEAERAAAAMRERTERDHVVMFAELEQERERVRNEVAALERCKAEAVAELNHLRELLGAAAGVVGQVAEAREPDDAPTQRIDAPAKRIDASDETVELPAVSADPEDE